MIVSYVVCMLIGIPIWWKTTQVYRAHLPLGEIEQLTTLKENGMIFPIGITVKYLGRTKEIIDDLRCQDKFQQHFAALAQEKENAQSSIRVTLKFEVKCQKIWIGDNEHLQNSLEKTDLKDIESIPELRSEGNSGQYTIFVIPNSVPDTQEFYFGNNRTLFFKIFELEPPLSEKIIGSLSRVIYGIFWNDLDSMVASLSIIQSDPSKYAVAENNLDNLRTIQSNNGYHVAFSLLNGDSEIIDLDWQIKNAVDEFINPFVEEMTGISEFEIQSQIQHFATLTIQIEKSRENSYNFLKTEALSRFVNKGEWDLVSPVSSFPSINCVIYIPDSKLRPVFIQDSRGEILPSNAFLIPRWGGVVIYNPRINSLEIGNRMIRLNTTDLQPLMKIFISQIRALIGIKKLNDYQLESFNINFATSPNGLTGWEKDALIRKNILQNLIKTSETLGSLSSLIQSIPNMAVSDEIQSMVIESISSFKKAQKHIEKSEYILGMMESKRSLSEAERGFFDPHILALLYFPDEHKYAIYVPLFLPVLVPVFLSVFGEIRSYVKKDKKKDDTKNEEKEKQKVE